MRLMMSITSHSDTQEDLRDAAPCNVLRFPDVPQMESAAVLGQSARGGRQVLTSQDRLGGLLRANTAIMSDLDLAALLRHITTASRDLVDAEYAALGVIGRDGDLEEFVHIGVESDVVSQIGDLLQGRGLLRFLLTDPYPLHLGDLFTQPTAGGPPPHHPAMRSFLAVPIRVGKDVYGNLYLASSAPDHFSVEDEQLVTALVATAGVAFANARLQEEALRQRQWLDSATELAQQLFADTGEAPLDMVVRYAVRGAVADSAAVAVLSVDGSLVVRASAGDTAAETVGTVLDMSRSLAGYVIQGGAPTATADLVTSDGELPRRLPGIGVPLRRADGKIIGALTVGRSAGGGQFSKVDRDQLAAFASHAGIVIELERARGAREAVRTVEDHDRIAADLNDKVIRELFATGMGLESMMSGLSTPDEQERVATFIDALDSTIRRIRTTIFQLQPGIDSTKVSNCDY
jgi:GAF domain-containing protein